MRYLIDEYGNEYEALTLCDVVTSCDDCPRMGDDCDGEYRDYYDDDYEEDYMV